jgi:hypothetical protein
MDRSCEAWRADRAWRTIEACATREAFERECMSFCLYQETGRIRDQARTFHSQHQSWYRSEHERQTAITSNATQMRPWTGLPRLAEQKETGARLH